MKIAVTRKGELVSEHYGQSDGFEIFTIEKEKVVSRQTFVNGTTRGCHITSELSDLCVEAIIAGGIGENAKRNLEEQNIIVFLTEENSIENAIELFIKGELKLGTNSHLIHSHGNKHEDKVEHHSCCGGEHHHEEKHQEDHGHHQCCGGGHHKEVKQEDNNGHHHCCGGRHHH